MAELYIKDGIGIFDNKAVNADGKAAGSGADGSETAGGRTGADGSMTSGAAAHPH